ncbi:MAG TPA: 16S rRNA (cytidine(1402)-2'-O)-methyltransferase [Candidatus Acidoferrales bacterium]|nr:16S rRNA (cytidine(1402)-2'-O)-methyltransferase [Candidatus Acidoferrales bacterium]
MPLVFVPTPLGNLGDVTQRAIAALRDAELIVAEDTRVARKLLGARGIPGRELWSYREQNAAGATPGILERARTGLVAVTTDAGMPGVSDPGSELIAAARAAGVPVEVLPGPSAALGVAVLSGFPLRRFVFEGFPPRGSAARRAAFREALRSGATTLWFESPQRVHEALADLDAVAPDARVFLVREYTKLHEQQALGSPAQVAAAIEKPARGEIAFAVAPYGEREAGEPAEASDAAIDALLAEGLKVADVARRLAKNGLGDRHELYARAQARRGNAPRGKGNAASAEET